MIDPQKENTMEGKINPPKKKKERQQILSISQLYRREGLKQLFRVGKRSNSAAGADTQDPYCVWIIPLLCQTNKAGGATR